MTIAVVASLWGIAEATLFFIVPDVFLTWVAVRDRRAAFLACAWATAGAVVGGLVMYWWGAVDLSGALRVLDAVPAIGADMIDRVGRDLETTGLRALFFGPLTGTPYKIYAVQSGGGGESLSLFLLVSVPARAIRFLLLTAVAASVAHGPARVWSLRRKRVVVAALWAAFYCWYFATLWGAP